MNWQILNPLRWKKSFLATILVAFVAIWFLFIDSYSFYTRYELNQRKADLQERIDELQTETEVLKDKIQELGDNPNLLEKIAREEYGMRKPGETVYIIEEK